MSTNVLHVLSKGAESAMYSACGLTEGEDKDLVDRHVQTFANLGLRTLVLGHKVITEQQFESFNTALESSSQSMVNR